MRMESNVEEIINKLNDGKKNAINQIGTLLVAEMIMREPVKTGNMRRSTTFQPTDDNDGVQVGVTNDAEYALYVDQGSSKQPAQHFMENAINANEEQIKNIIATCLKVG